MTGSCIHTSAARRRRALIEAASHAAAVRAERPAVRVPITRGRTLWADQSEARAWGRVSR